MFCAQCGLRLANTTKFCMGCGAPAYEDVDKYEQDKLDSGKNSAELIYLMYALSFIIIIPAFIGIFIAYGKVDAYKDTYLESHFNWAIKTFWLYLLGGASALLIIYLPIDNIIIKFLMLVAAACGLGIWVIYRIIKGWMLLSEFKKIKN